MEHCRFDLISWRSKKSGKSLFPLRQRVFLFSPVHIHAIGSEYPTWKASSIERKEVVRVDAQKGRHGGVTYLFNRIHTMTQHYKYIPHWYMSHQCKVGVWVNTIICRLQSSHGTTSARGVVSANFNAKIFHKNRHFALDFRYSRVY